MMSAPMASASRSPRAKAAARPWRSAKRTTRVTPSAPATSLGRSVLPSSTTRTPMVRTPGSWRATPASLAAARGLQLDFADAGAIADVGLAEGEPAQQGLELDLLAERHAIGGQPHAPEDRAAEHPHARLAVADRLEEQGRRRHGQHPVAEP